MRLNHTEVLKPTTDVPDRSLFLVGSNLRNTRTDRCEGKTGRTSMDSTDGRLATLKFEPFHTRQCRPLP